jgi:hypothetical protein
VLGNIKLTPTQHGVLYPKRDQYRERVIALDLADTLRNLSFKGPLYKSLEQNILPTLKRNAIPHESMSMVSWYGTRLVSMLGSRILCTIDEKEYRGVLAGITLDTHKPDEIVSLIITAAEKLPRHVRLRIKQLADGSAECDILADGDSFDGNDCVLVGSRR